jgi:hypothetical protein
MGCCICKLFCKKKTPAAESQTNSDSNKSENKLGIEDIIINSDKSFQTQIEIKTFESASANTFSIILDSSRNKCYKCETDSDLILLDCKNCNLCEQCIFETFQNSLEKKLNLLCNCKIPVSYPTFQDFILEENLLSYLEHLSSLSIRLPSKYACTCGKINKSNKYDQFNQCDCLKVNCLRCLQEHESSVSCLEFFKSRQKTCKICKTGAIFNLQCKCLICQKCCFANLKEQISDDAVSPLLCPVCSKILSKNDQVEVCGGLKRLIKLQEDSLLAIRFTCLICWKEKTVNGSITLYCQHRFCKKCVNLHIINELSSLASDETQIQCPSCPDYISYYIIDSILEGEALKRYHKRLVLNARLSIDDQFVKYCDVCDYTATVLMSDREFTCPNCDKKTCVKCNKPYSINCCNRQSSSNFGDLKDFIVKCPQCGSAVLKENGCNFLTCCWPDCKKVSFCFLCKKVLDVRFI